MKVLYMAAVAAAALASGQAAHAQATQLTAPFTGPSFTTPAYPGNSGDFIETPFALTTGGVTLTFAADNNGKLRRDDSGSTLAFAPGTSLIQTNNGTPFPGTPNDGPLTITFSKPVSEFSVLTQDSYFDQETFNFTTFSGGTNVGTFSVGPLDNSNPAGPGQSAFLGAFYAPGITSVKISSLSSQPTGSNDFFAGPVTIGTAVVPEPSGLASMAGGLFGLGALALAAGRRRRRTLS